jgi:6-phosphogluconolactonase/Glucosamine-6-phosphate isomerase/deaminase
MITEIFDTKLNMGQAAAAQAEKLIQLAIAERGVAYLIAATGASQFEFLDALVLCNIDWTRVVFFHLDEYVGLLETHPASFRRYLRERIVERVRPRAFHFINGDFKDVGQECRRVES